MLATRYRFASTHFPLLETWCPVLCCYSSIMSWLLQCGVVLGTFLLLLVIVLRLFVYFTLGICRSSASMKGKTIIVTGANSGMLICSTAVLQEPTQVFSFAALLCYIGQVRYVDLQHCCVTGDNSGIFICSTAVLQGPTQVFSFAPLLCYSRQLRYVDLQHCCVTEPNSGMLIFSTTVLLCYRGQLMYVDL
jgi:hypothetical protein